MRLYKILLCSLVCLLTILNSKALTIDIGTFNGSLKGVKYVTHATGHYDDSDDLDKSYQILDFTATNTNSYSVDFVFSLGDKEYSWFLSPNEVQNMGVRIAFVDEPIPVDISVERNDDQVGWEFVRESAQAKSKKIRKLIDNAIAGTTTKAEAQKVLNATKNLKADIVDAQQDSPKSERALFYPLIKIVNTTQTSAVKAVGANTERLREKYLKESRKCMVQVIGGKPWAN